MTPKAIQLLKDLEFTDFGVEPVRHGQMRFLRQVDSCDMLIYLPKDACDRTVVQAIFSAGRESHARDMQRYHESLHSLYRNAKPLPEDLPKRISEIMIIQEPAAKG